MYALLQQVHAITPITANTTTTTTTNKTGTTIAAIIPGDSPPFSAIVGEAVLGVVVSPEEEDVVGGVGVSVNT